ncbi:MAG: type II toxin-antitoxin system HicA family toxin [Synergistaceae bacterium]|nr:type II toxin-antitoxin system HicA family toxin [Synergistaceae bacterium]MBR0256258.1 type II toxin-antitoxin system HicA family toxin [Synergistaceae bacterium]
MKPQRHKKGTSHKQFKHPTRKGRVTVPYHKGFDLNIWEIKSIEMQSGLKFL